MATFGINYSNQIEKKKGLIKALIRQGKYFLIYTGNPAGIPLLLSPDPTFNNGKGSTIKLADELKETYDKLGYSQVNHQLAKELETRIVVPPKSDCKIM